MTFQGLVEASGGTIFYIVVAMAAVALLEVAIPLHSRGGWNRAHLAPNLTLTLITFATNLVFNGALVMALARLEASGLGLLPALALPPLATLAIVIAALDFSFYVAHVSMHKVPGFWRFHSVHHADPAVDVTTSIRQHPGEGVIRYAFLAAFACALGAPPAAFGVYRTASALSALLEHANIRLPQRLDDWLSLVTTWPGVHKVHHSRDPRLTDTNYGNLFSCWDRLFSTFTPARVGATIAYGLAGLDTAAAQTTPALLALPFRKSGVRPRSYTSSVGGPAVGVRSLHGARRERDEELRRVRG
jgi:sterol desaturase/sphingolipid hydroxylase (fatty acid hydroxylase superfamily)